jgi:DNA invertase Pin-like site-specific DNA recombinase
MQQHPARSRPGDPLRVAIYARVSSDQQAERHTIDSQVNDLMARAAADGREVGAELRFIDEGYSGASLVRPALERLRDTVAWSAVDVVYVHAPDPWPAAMCTRPSWLRSSRAPAPRSYS